MGLAAGAGGGGGGGGGQNAARNIDYVISAYTFIHTLNTTERTNSIDVLFCFVTVNLADNYQAASSLNRAGRRLSG